MGSWLGACSNNGGVHVEIELPTDALSPITGGLSRLDLVAEAPGKLPQRATRDLPSPIGNATIGFGDLDLGPGVTVTLLGFSATGRLVGFGRASTPIDITAGSAVDVPIRLRRPFAYVAGGASLLACDTTVEPGDAFVDTIAAAAAPQAVATTPDGAGVIAIGGGHLQLLSTDNHMPSGAPASSVLPGANQIAVSPDSRWAVVVHSGAGVTAGVSIIDLVAAARASVTPAFVPLGSPGGVAVSTDTAWVLVDPSVPGPDACTQQSALIPVTLASGTAGAPISLAGAARDLALSADGKTILVAEPCQNALVAVTGGGASQVRLIAMPNPTQVAVSGTRVWGLGSDSAPTEHLVLVSVNADGSASSRLDLAATQELANSDDLTEDGQTAEVRLDADAIEAYSMSVLPDGGNVVLLVHGTYHADAVPRDITVGGVTYREDIVPALDMETYEYQLVDVKTGVAAERMRTSCNIDWEHGVALLDRWSCASAQGQVTSATNFIASQATVLYGAH